MQPRSLLIPLVASGALAATVPAQNPRPSTQVDGVAAGTTGSGIGVASNGERSAIVWEDTGDGGVYVAMGDGRGLDWGAPVRVDSDPAVSDRIVQSDSVFVLGDNVYVVWEDERNGSTNSELYLNRSTDGGVTWAGEVRIDKNYAPGVGTIRDYVAWCDSDPLGAPDYVYILFTVDPNGSSNEELYIAISTDGGATFAPTAHVPQEVSPGDFDVDFIALSGHDRHCSVIWQDNRNGTFDDVFFQHTHFFGSAWQPTDINLKTNGAGVSDADFEMAQSTEGMTILSAWQEERTSATNEELRVNFSYDSGSTWQVSDVLIGGYPSTADVDNPAVAVNNGVFVVAWEDNRTGSDEVYASVSTDGGVTWVESQLSTAGGGFPTITYDSADAVLGVTWTSASFPNVVETAFSRDSGATWSTGITVSDNTDDVDFAEVAYNTRYENFVQAWLADDLGANHVYAGGFRPQTVTPVGTFMAGNSVSFDVSDFPSFENGFEFGVLASTGTGSYLTPAGDGRNTGLLSDAYLNWTLANIPGAMSGSIDASGAGSTPSLPFPAQIPPGTTVNLVAVSFDVGPPVTIGSLTDIVSVTTQ